MSSQYTRDVEFNSAFGALQTPVHLFTAACLCGVPAAPVQRPFRHLDLACGNGLTLSLLADAYPHAEFVGVDINPAHIEGASRRAREAGLNNVQFVQADIADLDAGAFEPFDYCAVSGVYSWLDRDRQARTRAFLQQAIKPGGLVYLDYSSLPGMAQVGPLYQILQQLAAAGEGDSARRLQFATQQLDAMRQGGARFFDQNPGAGQRLAGILGNPPEDEAHEVLNLQGFGLWSSAVIESLAEAGLAFVGNAGLHHNLDVFVDRASLPADCHSMPLPLQQALQDVAWNVAQRKDIYVRGPRPEAAAPAAVLADLPLYAAPGALSRSSRQQLGKAFPAVPLLTAAADDLEQALATATTFGDLFSTLAQRGHDQPTISALICNLLAARLLSVAVRPPVTAGAAADSGRLCMPSGLNRMILAEDIGQEVSRPFASPVAGSRLLLSVRDRIYLWAVVHGDVGGAWDCLGELRNAFRGERGEPLDRDGFIRVIEANLDNFRQAAVPELLRLGILTLTD